MKTLTSAAANKWIRTLEDEKSFYTTMEATSSVYVLSEDEQAEKPEYDYRKVQEALLKLDEQIRKIRHAVNVFNTTTILPSLNITIDEALVKMAQLNGRKNQLNLMRRRLPKQRVNSFMSRSKSVVEYEYANYDLEQVKEDYQKISEEIIQIQLALDMCNQTQTFEIDDEI